jgi:antitoxin VapB
MALNIKDDDADNLARAVADLHGYTLTQAVKEALQEKLDRDRRKIGRAERLAKLQEIARRCAALPVIDDRSEDEILGYDENGIPA